MSRERISSENFIRHFLDKVLQNRNYVLLELGISLFSIAQLKSNFMRKLSILKKRVIAFKKFSTCHIGIVEINNSCGSMD